MKKLIIYVDTFLLMFSTSNLFSQYYFDIQSSSSEQNYEVKHLGKIGIGDRNTSPSSGSDYVQFYVAPNTYYDIGTAVKGYIGYEGKAIHGVTGTNNQNAFAGYFQGKCYFSNRIGIKTTNPSCELDVKGKSVLCGKLTIGNMVGTKEFSHGVQVWGPGDLGAGARLLFGDNHDIDLGWRNVLVGENGDTDTDQLLLHGRNGIYFSTGRGGADNLGLITIQVYIDPEGKMVVKNKIETEEIEVKYIASNTLKTNTIKAEDINVSVNNVADYVFEENYELSSLSEVEKFIKENKHLPGIPAGEELEENGLNVAEMNNLLLQKIEEFTLYMIELKKENERMKQEIENLNSNF